MLLLLVLQLVRLTQALALVEGGRVIVPAAFRKTMGLLKGDTVFMEMHGDELHMRPARSALRCIQDKLKAHAPVIRNVSVELIVDRRQEAKNE